MLADQHKDLQQRVSLASGQIDSAVVAILRASPVVPALIEQFRQAQALAHDLRETMEFLVSNRALGDDLRPRNWDAPEWHADIAPHTSAARLKGWIERLRTDADAQLDLTSFTSPLAG
jgi:hypothetical protein